MRISHIYMCMGVGLPPELLPLHCTLRTGTGTGTGTHDKEGRQKRNRECNAMQFTPPKLVPPLPYIDMCPGVCVSMACCVYRSRVSSGGRCLLLRQRAP
jgi:hypothetical protein